MYSIIPLAIIACLLTPLQALPSSIERDASPADAIPALEERSPIIPIGDGGGVPSCWVKLSCTFHQIEAMSMPTRLTYVRYMESRFGTLKSSNQFRAIEGVIQFFIDKGIGGRGTWVSYVDAGIVEAIERGGAIALGIGKSKGGNPGAVKWAGFLTDMKNGKLKNRNKHDHDWSVSEQAGTDYGKKTAESISMVGKATKQQLRWYKFTQLFRKIMRNHNKVVLAIRIILAPTNPLLALGAEGFINWLTNITLETPTLAGSKIAWELAAFDLPLGAGAIINDAKLLKALVPKLYKAYKASK